MSMACMGAHLVAAIAADAMLVVDLCHMVLYGDGVLRAAFRAAADTYIYSDFRDGRRYFCRQRPQEAGQAVDEIAGFRLRLQEIRDSKARRIAAEHADVPLARAEAAPHACRQQRDGGGVHADEAARRRSPLQTGCARRAARPHAAGGRRWGRCPPSRSRRLTRRWTGAACCKGRPAFRRIPVFAGSGSAAPASSGPAPRRTCSSPCRKAWSCSGSSASPRRQSIRRAAPAR